LLVLGGAKGVEAQGKPDGPDVYGAKNSFGVMAEYSNDSSHIILGSSDNVKFGAVGVQYQRRLLAKRQFVLSYAAEFRPVILESIPTAVVTEVLTSPMSFTLTSSPGLTTKCTAGSFPFSYKVGQPSTTYAGTIYITCGRQMNYAQGFSPFGMRVNLRPSHRLQLTFSTLEGYIFSTKPLPVANAGSFNFTFDFGVGLEYYLQRHRSVRLEYRLQHYSNDYTAYANPGVDSGIFKLTYTFGR
jgi:opacity protein-like surface antigen